MPDPGAQWLRLAISVLCSIFTLAVAAARTSAAPPHVVYIESNDPRTDGNAILAYRRAADGSLTPLPGSPFATRGAGTSGSQDTVGAFDSDQNLAVSPDGSLLFAVNSGSNTIAVFRIEEDGSLTHVDGSPFPSGGIQPVSLGLSGNRLYVVNKDEDPAQDRSLSAPNYTGFTIGLDGGLAPIDGSTVEVDFGSSPSQALVSPNGALLFGADFGAGNLQAFQIAPEGQLLQAPDTPQRLPEFVPDPALPLGLAVHPGVPVLYVGFVSFGALGVYAYDDAGALSFVNHVGNSGIAICWLAINREGTALYSCNTGDNSLSWYDLTDPQAPVERQYLPLPLAGSGGPFQAALDPTGQFLYVVSQRLTDDPNDLAGNAVHILAIGPDGSLSQPFSPLDLPVPTFARPQGIVVL